MAGRSSTGTTIGTGKLFMSQSQGARSGPSNKNLATGATRRPNPAPEIRSIAGKSIMGPDLGAGGK